jgi:ubiquinone/menaquinone biosynthesis C-methylase UbiE
MIVSSWHSLSGMADSEQHLDAIREQFTRQAEAYVRMRQTSDEPGLEALVRLSGAAPEHRVLDVACGPGFLTMAFAARCAHAIGVDATDRFVELARAEAAARNLDNIEFRAGDAEVLGFADATFDIVSCRAAFHHFPHPERVLREMRRVMKPDGRMLVADMLGSEDSALAAYHNRIERLCDPTHVRALPESEFARLFGAAGLRILLSPTMEIDYDFEEWVAHGGPPPDVEREIVRLMEDSLAVDRCGLKVRRENGRLRFSHQVAAFVLMAA